MTVIGAHPQRLDLTVHPGDPVAVSIPVLDSTGAPQTITGWTVGATIHDVAGLLVYDFAPTIVSNQIRIVATPAQTRGWAWPFFAARLVVTATPPAGAASEVAVGWVRLYNP